MTVFIYYMSIMTQFIIFFNLISIIFLLYPLPFFRITGTYLSQCIIEGGWIMNGRLFYTLSHVKNACYSNAQHKYDLLETHTYIVTMGTEHCMKTCIFIFQLIFHYSCNTISSILFFFFNFMYRHFILRHDITHKININYVPTEHI